MTASHNDDISVLIGLGPPPSATAAYRLLILVPLAANGLDGADFMAFASIADAAAAEDAGDISAATLDRVTVALSQSPRPDLVYVGAVDLAGSETYPGALSRLEELIGDLFFGVCIESRDAAIVLAVSAAVEATGRRLFASVDDSADWLAGSVPAALSAAEGREYTAIVYHDEAAAHPDVAWLARLLATDPSLKSARGPGQMAGVPVLDTMISRAQRVALIEAGANVGMGFSTATNYLSPAQNLARRSVSEIVTLEWVRREIPSRIGARSLALAPGKWPVNAEGQSQLEDILRALAAQGEAVGHFDPGQTIVNALPITAEDRDLARLRAEFIATVQGHAIRFVIDGTLDRQPVIVE